MGVRAVRLASLYPAGGDTPPLQEGLYRNDTSIADPQSNGGLQPKLLEPMPARNVRRREAPFVLGVRPPKNPVPRFPEDNPSVTFGDQRGPIGPFSLRNVHRTFLRALEPPYTGEAFGNDLSRQRFALPPTGACRPVLARNSPLDCFSGSRTP